MYKGLNESQDETSNGDENLDKMNDDDDEYIEDSDGDVIVSPCKNKNSGSGSESVVTAATPSPNPKTNIDDDILIDWTFPGYIYFSLYGPFVEKHDR